MKSWLKSISSYCVISLIFVAWFSSAFAGNDQDDLDALIYTSATKISREVSERERIGDYLRAQNFFDLSNVTPFKSTVDSVYANANLSKVIFVRYNIETKVKPGLVYQTDEGDFVFHSRTKSGLAFGVMFSGFSKSAVNTVLLGIQSQHATSRKSGKSKNVYYRWQNIFDLLNSRAQAREVLPICAPPESFAKNMQNLAEAVSFYKGKCAWNALVGSANTVGSVAGVGVDMAVDIYKGSFWKKAKENWNASKDLMGDFNKIMAEKYQGFFRLNPAKQAEIFCRFAGIAATTGVLTYASWGAAAPVTLVAASSLVSSLETASEVSDDIKKIKCRPIAESPSLKPSGESGALLK